MRFNNEFKSKIKMKSNEPNFKTISSENVCDRQALKLFDLIFIMKCDFFYFFFIFFFLSFFF